MVQEIQGSYDKHRDWNKDPMGYFLIKIYPKEKKIGLRYCNNNNKVLADIFGKTPQELYHTAIKKGLIPKVDHAAYLGKELMKAFFCLKTKRKYVQDEEEAEMKF